MSCFKAASMLHTQDALVISCLILRPAQHSESDSSPRPGFVRQRRQKDRDGQCVVVSIQHSHTAVRV